MNDLNMSLVKPGSVNPLLQSILVKPAHERNTPPYTRSGRKIPEQYLESSSMQRQMAGNRVPGMEQLGRVKSIHKDEGATRLVTFEDGTQVRVTKRRMVHHFNKSLQGEGMANAMKSIKVDKKTGRVKAQIGGQKQGFEKEYQSVKRAEAAIRKYYSRRVK